MLVKHSPLNEGLLFVFSIMKPINIKTCSLVVGVLSCHEEREQKKYHSHNFNMINVWLLWWLLGRGVGVGGVPVISFQKGQ